MMFHDGPIASQTLVDRSERRERPRPVESTDLNALFHRLNNQLGIILANAELLETKSTDAMGRARATQVVGGALDALGTAKEIRVHVESSRSIP